MVGVEMIILHDRKIVFVSTAKAGTHTIFSVLLALGGEQLPGRFHRRLIPPEYAGADWFVLTVVRNPYTRAMSSWQQIATRAPRYERWLVNTPGLDFDTFLDFLVAGDYDDVDNNLACVTQADWLADVPHDHVMRLENLEAELRSLGLWQEAGPPPNEHHTPYERPLLTPARRRKIEAWAAADFETFGYPTVAT